MTCWIQSLHEYVMSAPPQGEDEDAIRIFLCTPRSRIDSLPKNIASSIRAWLNKSPDLVYRHALSCSLPYNEDFHRLGGSLLTWGLTLPWAEEIQVQSVLDQWHNVLHEPNLFSDNLALNMAYATSIVRDLLPQLQPLARIVVADFWLNRVMRSGPQSLLWQINMYSASVRECIVDAWCDFYTIARARNSSGDTAALSWLKCMEAALKSISYDQSSTLLMLLSRNQLPDTIKVLAAAYLPASVWLHPNVASVLILIATTAAPDPSMRLIYLPWTQDSNMFGKNNRENWDINRRICDMYCPELMPIFVLVPVDWLDKAMVCRVAQEYTSQKNESLPVVGLLEQEPSTSWYN